MKLKFNKMKLCICILKYLIGFSALCTANHCFSVTLFYLCGYCLLTYAVVYTFCLVTVSFFLSTVVFHIFIRKDDKKRILDDLRGVKYEDVPYVMVSLLKKVQEREPSRLTDKSDSIIDERLCVACYEAAPTIMNIPCGHMVLCSSCNWHLLRVSIENKSALICSWCRTGIKDFEGEMRPNLELIEWEDVRDALLDLQGWKTKRNKNVNYG